MSVEYLIDVHRNCDGKKIASFWCNAIKCIMDDYVDEFDIHHLDQQSQYSYAYRCCRKTFSIIANKIKDKIRRKQDEILEKRFMLPMCVKVEIKEVLEQDICDIDEEINELYCQLESVSSIIGAIYANVEDNVRYYADNDCIKSRMAYEYNAEDLPVKTKTYADGKSCTCSQTVFVDDTYMIVKRS